MAQPPHQGKDHKLRLTFVVTGQPVPKEVPGAMPIHAAVSQVLAETKNTGQPASNWILTYDSKELDQSKTFEAAGIPDGAKLYLTIRSGRGGFGS